jgi:hypothetical protein
MDPPPSWEEDPEMAELLHQQALFMQSSRPPAAKVVRREVKIKAFPL